MVAAPPRPARRSGSAFALAGMAVYLGLQSLFAKTTTRAVLAGFLLTQLHILWRSWIKVAYQGAELSFYSQSAP